MSQNGSAHKVDGALSCMIDAATEPDSAKRSELYERAHVFALMALTDAIKETGASLKEVANRNIEATCHLDATIQKATNAVVIELRKVSVKEAA